MICGLFWVNGGAYDVKDNVVVVVCKMSVNRIESLPKAVGNVAKWWRSAVVE